MQIITIVEADVPEEKESALKTAYEALASLPEGLLQSYLLQGGAHARTWRIVSVWKNREALERMRHTTDKPAAIALFEAIGARPTISIWEAVSEKS